MASRCTFSIQLALHLVHVTTNMTHLLLPPSCTVLAPSSPSPRRTTDGGHGGRRTKDGGCGGIHPGRSTPHRIEREEIETWHRERGEREMTMVGERGPRTHTLRIRLLSGWGFCGGGWTPGPPNRVAAPRFHASEPMRRRAVLLPPPPCSSTVEGLRPPRVIGRGTNKVDLGGSCR